MFANELGIPIAAFLLFFYCESRRMFGEWGLAAFLLTIIALLFAVLYHNGEWPLFFIGVAFGAVIEIGMRYFGAQQKWRGAHLFGIPYWLPLAWGVGFVVITRIGFFVRALY